MDAKTSAKSEKSITSATLVGKAQSHWLSSRGPRYGTREQPRLGQSVRRRWEREREKEKETISQVFEAYPAGPLRVGSRGRLGERWRRASERGGKRSAISGGLDERALLLWGSYNIPVSSAVEQRAPPFTSWMTIRRRGTEEGLRDAGWVIASLTDHYYVCRRTHRGRTRSAI